LKDTPENIKNFQLQLWLSKSKEERLLHFIKENDAWWKALNDAKKNFRSKDKEVKPVK